MLIRISGNSSDVGLQDCRNPLIYWLPWWPFPSSCVNCLCSLSPLAGSVPYSPGKPHQVSPICFVSLYSHSFFLPLCKTKPSQLVLGSHGLSFLPRLCLITLYRYLQPYLLSVALHHFSLFGLRICSVLLCLNQTKAKWEATGGKKKFFPVLPKRECHVI